MLGIVLFAIVQSSAKDLDIYPLHLKMQVSASRERVSYKAWIEENSCSIVEIHNAGDDPLSACPQGAKLEKLSCVALLDKDATGM
jgi:hypothetical protein